MARGTVSQEKINLASLRDHRKSIYEMLEQYVEKSYKMVGIPKKTQRVRILKSIKFSRIRLPKEIVPDEFVMLTLKANETKKFRFEFRQNHPEYIHVILKNKPLIAEGEGALFYFFRELLQHLEKMPKASTQLALVVNR